MTRRDNPFKKRSGNIEGLRLYKACTFGEPPRPGVRSLGYMRERTQLRRSARPCESILLLY